MTGVELIHVVRATWTVVSPRVLNYRWPYDQKHIRGGGATEEGERYRRRQFFCQPMAHYYSVKVFVVPALFFENGLLAL
jgi:hypothetical protein